jgi:hypothetical protein
VWTASTVLLAVTGPSTKLNRGPVRVLLAERRERALTLPDVEDLELETVMVGLVRKRCEDLRHRESSLGRVSAVSSFKDLAFANDTYERNE